MSDAALRAMDRPGVVVSFTDRVHRLNAKMRAGRVTRDRVELAAWCKSAAACAVIGREEPVPFPGEDWWTGLRRFGGEVCARATAHVLLAVKARSEHLPFIYDEPEAALNRAVGTALLAWCDSPARSHAKRNGGLERALQEVLREHQRWPDQDVGALVSEFHSPMSLAPRAGSWRNFWAWAVRRVYRLDEAAGPYLCVWAIGEAP